MENGYSKSDAERWAYMALVCAAFCCGFSPVVAGRSFLAISLLLLMVHLFMTRSYIVMPLTARLWVTFIILAIFSTAMGPAPARGFGNMSKLSWFIGIPLCATLVTSIWRLSDLLRAYALGSAIGALRVIVCNPVIAWQNVRDGKASGYMWAILDLGSMDSAQIFMLGIVISLGFVWMCHRAKKGSAFWWTLLVIQTVALILMFKRGSWVCACLAVVAFVIFKTNWRYLLLLIVVIAGFVALPPVRARVVDLKSEWNVDKGGRMTMWLKIAPALRAQYPLGIGYQVLTNEMMRKIEPRVERDRKHLHSNVVQVLVDTGWAGLLVFLVWMGKALFDAAWIMWKTRGGQPLCEMFSVVLFLMLAALFLNGFVEYNFGRAPIVPAYGIIIGCIAAGRRLVSSHV
ncbi:O-antigen ligase domain-containing protein [Candidatus Parcubacteria bacterium]|nr:MAG: O-antigen ligase domain-containing protein [Candidatus Parcubacteria bacterium]